MAALDHFLEVVDRALAVRRHRADGVVRLVRQHRHRRCFQAIVLRNVADRFEMRRIADVKNGELDAVVTGSLKFTEQVEVRVSDMTRPKEEVKTNFHEKRRTT